MGLTYFERISSNLLGISVILFVQAFLNLKKRYPKWDRVMRMFIYAYVLFGILLYIHEPIATILSAITGLGSITLIISVAIKSVRDKYPSALFFLTGYSMFLLSIVLLISVVLGIIPYNIYIIEFALPIGSTIEILLFSFALANMINVLRRENEIKQARIIFQLEENKQLQSKVNRELEEKVVERTLEIQKQKEIIEQEKDKSDQLLLNILPEATANELKAKGFSTPKQHEEVSVMFTDFVGFSKISKHISAAKLELLQTNKQ